jgi:hypothetical protein
MVLTTRDPLITAILDALDLRERGVSRIQLDMPANDVAQVIVTMHVDRDKLMAALVAFADQERIAAATKAAGARA